jgi:hypothetical protein
MRAETQPLTSCSGMQCPKCTQCIAQQQQWVHQGMQGAYWHGWRRSGCLDAETRVLAVGVLVSTTYNNLTADLLPLPTRRVPCHQPGAGLAGWAKNLGVLPLQGLLVAFAFRRPSARRMW